MTKKDTISSNGLRDYGPKSARGDDSTEQTGFPSCKYHNTKETINNS